MAEAFAGNSTICKLRNQILGMVSLNYKTGTNFYGVVILKNWKAKNFVIRSTKNLIPEITETPI